MYRANTSFSTQLPDGTERDIQQGAVVGDDDILLERVPQYFTTVESTPEQYRAPAKRQPRSAKQ
jgi:hypothetical protein